MVEAPDNLAAVLNPTKVDLISSTATPSGANLAVMSVMPSNASTALSPNVFCASAAIFCDLANVPDSLVNNFKRIFNLLKFAAVFTACLASIVRPTPAIAVFNPPNDFCNVLVLL